MADVYHHPEDERWVVAKRALVAHRERTSQLYGGYAARFDDLFGRLA